MLYLYLQAPFATFRTFSAGSFRPTAPFMTYSSAFGLLLNLAGVEMRHDDQKLAMTGIRADLPAMKIALGEVAAATTQVLYQQLHNYPVGPQGKAHAQRTMGNKYNIVPVRRAMLTDLRVCIAMQGGGDLDEAIVKGLAGGGGRSYGLPFVGDNNFLPDRIDVLDTPRSARWVVPVEDGAVSAISPMRLTVTIDRADMSKTSSHLYQFTETRTSAIPESAWVSVDYG